MAGKELVLGIFESEAAADKAVETLRDVVQIAGIPPSDIGVLVVDEQGQLKQNKMGQRRGGKGAGIGLVLAAVAPPTLLVGMVGGAVVGHFFQRGVSVSKEVQERLAAELAGGKAAVGIMIPPEKVVVVTDYMSSLGAQTETHELSDEALEAAAAEE